MIQAEDAIRYDEMADQLSMLSSGAVNNKKAAAYKEQKMKQWQKKSMQILGVKEKKEETPDWEEIKKERRKSGR